MFNLKKSTEAQIQEPTGTLMVDILELIKNSNNPASLMHLEAQLETVKKTTKERYKEITGEEMLKLKFQRKNFSWIK